MYCITYGRIRRNLDEILAEICMKLKSLQIVKGRWNPWITCVLLAHTKLIVRIKYSFVTCISHGTTLHMRQNERPSKALYELIVSCLSKAMVFVQNVAPL